MSITCCENHKTESLTINGILKTDPTRTLFTRKRFVTEMNKRFAHLKKRVKEGIVVEGRLLKNAFVPFPIINTPIDWASRYDPDKIPDFMDWLTEQNERFILSKGQAGLEIIGQKERWTDLYIRSAYQKGVARARAELRKGGMDIPSFESRLIGGDGDPFGLGGVFSQPFHADRVRFVYTQTYEGLKGITKAMDAPISRILAEGMAQGRNPKEIAKSVSERIDKIGLTRARTLARTEVIRAHHNANINEYERAGIEGVTVKAEWVTAGFNVCVLCQANEGRVFTLKDIRGLIPLHPSCRCVALPIVPSDKKFKKKN